MFATEYSFQTSFIFCPVLNLLLPETLTRLSQSSIQCQLPAVCLQEANLPDLAVLPDAFFSQAFRTAAIRALTPSRQVQSDKPASGSPKPDLDFNVLRFGLSSQAFADCFLQEVRSFWLLAKGNGPRPDFLESVLSAK